MYKFNRSRENVKSTLDHAAVLYNLLIYLHIINCDQTTISMFVILITQQYNIIYFVWGAILYIVFTVYIIINNNIGRYILKYANVINGGVYCYYIVCTCLFLTTSELNTLLFHN